MVRAVSVPQVPSRARGRLATHDPESLLDLVAAVACAAVQAGHAVTPERCSMPVFNRVKLVVDGGRGIASPKTDPERTPSAEAIQMRFKQLAGAPAKWQDLVRVALLPSEERTMWLSALRRDEARHDSPTPSSSTRCGS